MEQLLAPGFTVDVTDFPDSTPASTSIASSADLFVRRCQKGRKDGGPLSYM